MITHELKTDSEPFNDVWKALKTFEIRLNDRNFQLGDVLLLRETKFTGEEMKKEGKPLTYTGRFCKVKILHIMEGPIYGLAEKWCILSIYKISTVMKGKE